MSRLIACILLVMCWLVTMFADNPVTFTVYPRMSFVPSTVVLTIKVQRDEHNRKLTWDCDGPNYYRNSEIQLNGATAPITYTMRIALRDAGEYTCMATVERNDNTRSIAKATFRVVGDEHDEATQR